MSKNNSEFQSKLTLILAMVIFGTIGIFRKYIPLPSSVIAMARGFIGMLFLLLVVLVKRERPSAEAIKANLFMLILSGVALGFNWILLFEAYQYTTVATATLCYYMAPILVIMVSPILFGERLNKKKILCVIVALLGMVLVSGVLQSGVSQIAELRGILLGLGAAVLYASVILLNKRIKDISAYDKTILQLGVAAIVLLPYTFITENMGALTLTPLMLVMLIVVGVIHTGVAYALYFGSMKNLKAQTVALYSYIDPIVAIILSALFLHEGMGILEVVGACMVLGATMISEFE